MPITGPYENARFLVIFEGVVIPDISGVSSLEWTADVLTLNEGGSSVSLNEPGRIKYQPLTLEREVNDDLFFEEWAQLVAHPESAGESIFRDLRIDILNPAGRTVVSYKVFRSFPITFEAFSSLDADGTQILKERLVLIYQSFERDTSVVAPA